MRRHGVLYALGAIALLVVVVFPSVRPSQRRSGNAERDQPEAGSSQSFQAPAGVDNSPDGSASVTAGTPVPGVSSVSSVGRRDGTGGGGSSCRTGAPVLPSQYARPCIPAFSGDNGGVTSRGISRDTIKVATLQYPDSANARFYSALYQQAGFADSATDRKVRDTFVPFLNRAFQLYGRKVEFVTYYMQHVANGEGSCADAIAVAEEVKAFAVLSAGDLDFVTCAAQRHLVVFDAIEDSPESVYARYHPYLWSPIMDCDRTAHQVAEYVAKRLAGRKARWAGDAAYRMQTRKLGLLTGEGEDGQCSKIFTDDYTGRYRQPAPYTVHFNSDPTRLAEQSTAAVAQLKAQGVTSVLLGVDPVSIIFLTKAATAQDWHPEWITTGVQQQTIDFYGRLYDQQQVDGHLFGRAYIPPFGKVFGPTSEPGRLYHQLTGKEIPAGTDGGYWYMVDMFDLLQSAGPHLDPFALAAGAARQPGIGNALSTFGPLSYSSRPDGTPGLDHTREDSSVEVYWDGSATAWDGKKGGFLFANGGRWFGNGEWSRDEPPIYPDR